MPGLTRKTALGSYISFLGVIWSTWLQVTLFDVRFARDSVFERVCKSVQLAAMVGFASAGTRISTRIRDDNIWAFQSLSVLLGMSRVLLAMQYMVNILLARGKLRPSSLKALSIIAGFLFVLGMVYFVVCIFSIDGVYGLLTYVDVFCFLQWTWDSFTHMDCLVRIVWVGNVDGYDYLSDYSWDRISIYSFECAYGSSHFDHHW